MAPVILFHPIVDIKLASFVVQITLSVKNGIPISMPAFSLCWVFHNDEIAVSFLAECLVLKAMVTGQEPLLADPRNNVNPGLIKPWLLLIGGCPLLVGIHHFWREHPTQRLSPRRPPPLPAARGGAPATRNPGKAMARHQASITHESVLPRRRDPRGTPLQDKPLEGLGRDSENNPDFAWNLGVLTPP